MNRAFIFPGQGSQIVGMAKDFYDNFDEAKAINTIPLKRLGLPTDVVNLTEWLISDLSSYMTGCIIPLAGGR